MLQYSTYTQIFTYVYCSRFVLHWSKFKRSGTHHGGDNQGHMAESLYPHWSETPIVRVTVLFTSILVTT